MVARSWNCYHTKREFQQLRKCVGMLSTARFRSQHLRRIFCPPCPPRGVRLKIPTEFKVEAKCGVSCCRYPVNSSGIKIRISTDLNVLWNMYQVSLFGDIEISVFQPGRHPDQQWSTRVTCYFHFRARAPRAGPKEDHQFCSACGTSPHDSMMVEMMRTRRMGRWMSWSVTWGTGAES